MIEVSFNPFNRVATANHGLNLSDGGEFHCFKGEGGIKFVSTNHGRIPFGCSQCRVETAAFIVAFVLL